MSDVENDLNNFEKVEDYFNKVDVYSTILKNNYMFHVEIFDLFRTFLRNAFSNKPFTLLDIGCGNAFYMSQVLKDFNVDSYEAYDLAIESLNEAKKNMERVNCKKNFINADIAKDFLDSELKQKFDVIWTSYALHHLNLKDKARFFKHCKKVLKDNSSLIVVDFINDYNSREECLERYKESVEKKWTIFSKEEKAYLYDHVYKFDFPESFLKYKGMAQEAGFKNAEKLFQEDSWAFMKFCS